MSPKRLKDINTYSTLQKIFDFYARHGKLTDTAQAMLADALERLRPPESETTFEWLWFAIETAAALPDGLTLDAVRSVLDGLTAAGSLDAYRQQAEDAWAATVEMIQGQMTRATFNDVVRGARVAGRIDGTLAVIPKSKPAYDWLTGRLKTPIERAVGATSNHTITDVIFLEPEAV